MRRKIRIGVRLAPQHVDYPTIRRAAARAETELALGVSLFVVRNPGPGFDFGELRDWLAWRDERRN